MRKINKGSSPQDFEEWKRNNPEASFRELPPGSVKSNLKQALLNEQYGLCGYCCTQIDNAHSHVEHIIPHCSGNQQLDYNNLICSCNGYAISRNTCGHKKDNAKIPITPLDDDCESRFIYKLSGKIDSASDTDEDAKSTINILNLNSYELETARKTHINLLMHNEEIEKDKQSYINKYSSPVNGQLEAFAPMMVYVIKNYI